MLKRHEIKVLLKAGHSQIEVAKLAGVSLRSVKRIAKDGDIDHVDDAAERRRREIGRPSLVQDFRKPVAELLEKEPDLLSVEVLRLMRLEGYTAQTSALYSLIASVRPKDVKPMVRFEGLPGEFSQHDFGQVDVEYLDGSTQRIRFCLSPEVQTANALMLMAKFGDREEFLFVVVRGDTSLSEQKLARLIGADELFPASEEQIKTAGAEPGYASPIRLKNVRVIVDQLIPVSPNLVAGANEHGYHLLNTNYGRDYVAQTVCDLAAAQDGAACTACGAPLRAVRGVEFGNIFKLGTRYSAAINATYFDADGVQKPIVMGSFGIGSGRLLACVAEEHHDDKGLIWPITVAPYQVHLVSLGQPEAADRIYETLLKAGIEVLYDDREESPLFVFCGSIK